jgi:cobalamin biosynthesis protein CobW
VKIVPANNGRLDLPVLLGLNSASEETIDQRHDHHGSSTDAEHHHHDDFDSVVVSGDPASREAAIAALQTLVANHTIYRA